MDDEMIEEVTIPTDRDKYTNGLRMLADFLDENQDFNLPHMGCDEYSRVLWFEYGNDAKYKIKAMARNLPGKIEKSYSESDFNLTGKLDGLHYKIFAKREAICERIVTGTKMEIMKVPIGEVEYEYVEKEVEIVDWICDQSLLAN